MSECSEKISIKTGIPIRETAEDSERNAVSSGKTTRKQLRNVTEASV